MSTYSRFTTIDANYNFPPEVRQALANSFELRTAAREEVSDRVDVLEENIQAELLEFNRKDTTAPGRPVAPELSMAMGAVTIRAINKDTDGNEMPMDFKEYIIMVDNHDGASWKAEGGVIPSPDGSVQLYGKPAGEISVALVAVDTSKNGSDVGLASKITVIPIETAEEVRQDYMERQAEVDDLIATFEGSVDEAITKAETAAAAATSAEARATEANNRAMTRLANGSFESNLMYWRADQMNPSNGPLPVISTDAFGGGKSAHFVGKTTAEPDTGLPVVEGQIWDLSYYIKGYPGIPTGQFESHFDGFRDSFSERRYIPGAVNIVPVSAATGEWVLINHRFVVPDDISTIWIRLLSTTGGNWFVDEVSIRDVTDVIRLEEAANAARQKAEAAEAKAIAVELAQGGIRDRLDQAEENITEASAQAAEDLSGLDTRLTEAFQRGDLAIKQTADDAQTAAAEAKEAAVAAALLRIDSSRGTTFKNNSISTVLTVIVFYAGMSITNITQLHEAFGPGSYLEWFWRREEDDEFGLISSSDNRLSNGGFALTVSPNDVDEKTIFQCYLNA